MIPIMVRFNLDKSQGVYDYHSFSVVWGSARNTIYLIVEDYDAELEHMNASMIAENQGLQHDNKQLNALIKEYEQTLETLMS